MVESSFTPLSTSMIHPAKFCKLTPSQQPL